MILRHIEFTIDFDLTCYGESEDFEIDNDINIKEDIEDWVVNESSEFLPYIKIKKIWYEEA